MLKVLSVTYSPQQSSIMTPVRPQYMKIGLLSLPFPFFPQSSSSSPARIDRMFQPGDETLYPADVTRRYLVDHIVIVRDGSDVGLRGDRLMFATKGFERSLVGGGAEDYGDVVGGVSLEEGCEDST